MPWVFSSAIATPKPVTALSFASGSEDVLAVGCGTYAVALQRRVRDVELWRTLRADDGSMRLYRLPSTTAFRAVRGLGAEVSSVQWGVSPTATATTREMEMWAACGNKVLASFLSHA